MRLRIMFGFVLVTGLLSFGLSQSVKATTTTPAALLLKHLKVSAEHNTGYDRSYFNLWVDANHDGCNTRKEVLLAEAVSQPSETSSCSLSGGTWRSAYDNLIFHNARELDIDHMVPLSEAWQSGAYRWDADTRERYANDLGYSRSLIAVSATTNRAKGDQDPYLWMPPRHAYWCQYIDDWIAIKYRWGLTIDPTEKRDLTAKVKGCGTKAKTLKPALAVRHFSNTPVDSGSGGSGSGGSGGGSGSGSQNDPRFATCAKAKAAGYGPYYRGRDPEYDWYRDANGDGIDCQ